ncbi:hypothetical protein PG997_008145 [Apiospora hydei]|uniref:Serine protease n=1 Tax=Apiospora hydei TaxID=1337664 RepID=A0ABR1WA24_9PEZI
MPTNGRPGLTSMHPILPNPNKPDRRLANIPPPNVVTISEAHLMSLYNITAPPPPSGSRPAAAQQQQKKRETIGPDDRVRWDDTNYPYSAMGRLTGPTFLCSASLIGPRHVATARHCHFPEIPYYFAPAYNGGEVLPGAQVTTVLMPAEPFPEGACGEPYDWAIFILDKPLGEQLGYLGANSIDDSKRGKPIFYNYGYPGDKDSGSRPYRQQSITVSTEKRCDATGPLDTDADTSQGQSGGPLWLEEDGNIWQYGVFSLLWWVNGVYAMASFASGDGFVAGVVHARETWP